MRRIVTSSECDSLDEVQKLLQELFDGQEQMDTKICQLAKQKRVPKKKVKKTKKGSVLMKTLISLVVLTILIFSSVCSGAYVAKDITSWICANPDILEIYLRDTVGAGTYVFTPIAAPAGNDIIEGKMYYDSSANTFYGSKNGTTWTEFATGGATSLDAAYNVGFAIDVDGTGVTLDNDVGDGTILLILTQDDTTNDPDAISITNAADAATAVSIDIDGTAGFDIQGTSDSWSVSIAGIFDGEGLTAVTNSQAILFDTNNEIEFGDNSEDVSMVFTGNTVTWATDSLVDQMAFGVVDNLTGVGAIAFDDAASTITLTSTGATDLTISQATADQDASLILQSSGTGTDALSLISSVGDIKIASADNIDIDAADNIAVDTAGGTFTVSTIAGDITLDSTTLSVVIRGTQEAADAILLDADGTAGGIELQCGTGDITLDSGDDIFLEADTGTGDVISLINTQGTDDASIVATATAGGIDVDAAKSINMASSEETADAISFDASGAAGGVILASGTGDITLDTGDDIFLAADTGTGDVISLINTQGTNAAAIVVTTVAAGSIDINSGDNITIDAADDITIDTVDGGVSLIADGAVNGDITLDSENDIILTTTGKLTITNTEAVTMSGALTVTGVTSLIGATTTTSRIIVDQVVTDQATFTVTAAMSGKILTIANLAQNTAINLPAEADGLNYEFWYIGTAVETHDHLIDSEDDGNPFLGGLAFHDTDDGSIASVWSDNSSNSELALNNIDGGTIIKITCDGTNWYITGTVISDTAPAFSDQ